MNSDILLVLVAGYTIYKIGWVDGWTAVNAFLVLCLVIIAAASVFRRTAYWKRMKQARDDAETGEKK